MVLLLFIHLKSGKAYGETYILIYFRLSRDSGGKKNTALFLRSSVLRWYVYAAIKGREIRLLETANPIGSFHEEEVLNGLIKGWDLAESEKGLSRHSLPLCTAASRKGWVVWAFLKILAQYWPACPLTKTDISRGKEWSLFSEGTGKFKKSLMKRLLDLFWERSLFFSFQTAIPREWEIKERVHEEMEIAGMCKKLSYEGKMEHLLGRTTKSRYCLVNIRQTNPFIKKDTKETMLLIKRTWKRCCILFPCWKPSICP